MKIFTAISFWTFPISSATSVACFSRCMCCLRALAAPVHVHAYFIFNLQNDCVFPHHWRSDMEAAYALRDYVWWSIHLLSSARLFLWVCVCVWVCVRGEGATFAVIHVSRRACDATCIACSFCRWRAAAVRHVVLRACEGEWGWW